MDSRLLELLVCPICKGPLEWRRDASELVCHADRLAFPVRDGIAVMLESEARPVEANTDTTP
ncbi:MAG TPA: Trm112 family protein [Ideonella sp.]|nr:Trm112 family protein [Ideonella sp.]